MILIIAYGNSLRQDDGAGFVLAEQLARLLLKRNMPVRQLAVQQLVPELAPDLARADVSTVVFVDTCLIPSPVSAAQVQITPLIRPDSLPALGHHLHPALLLVYAARLYGQSPPAWLLTVPGISFGYGESFSGITYSALEAATTVLEPWIEELLERETRVSAINPAISISA